MATLLPSLSSDEEDFGKTFSKDVPEKDSINRKNDRQVPQTLKGEDLSDESSEDEVDAEFEFGGLLVRRKRFCLDFEESPVGYCLILLICTVLRMYHCLST